MADVVIEGLSLRDILNEMYSLYAHLKDAKPGDRSEIDRSVAVTLTDLEKIIAYYKLYVVEGR